MSLYGDGSFLKSQQNASIVDQSNGKPAPVSTTLPVGTEAGLYARIVSHPSLPASRLDAANLCVTNTGLSGAAVTLTLPAVAAQFHYIGFIHIAKFAVALLTAGATPVLVTTTNLPGSPVFSFPADAAAAGTEFLIEVKPATPVRSSVINTATTIVCPATTSLIWRVTAWYYAAV